MGKVRKRVLCYGDSNTWGYTPETGERYSASIRWPGAMQRILGGEFFVIEAGLNGRTSVFTDPFFPFRNGLESLATVLLENDPLDMVILALGTNDLQFTDARGAARGGRALIYQVRSICGQIAEGRFWPTDGRRDPAALPEILLMSPILIHENVREMDPWSTLVDGPEQSRSFARWYAEVAENERVHFLDAAAYASPCDSDGIHMGAEAHTALGRAVAEKIREIFAER